MGPSTTKTVNDGAAVDRDPVTAPTTSTDAQAHAGSAVPGRRAGHAWVGLIPGMVALALVLVFVFQNPRDTKVSFLVLSGEVPLGLALVTAALLGGMVVFGLGSVRIVQLRKLARGRYRTLQKRS